MTYIAKKLFGNRALIEVSGWLTDVLGGVRPLFLFPEKQLPHPFVCNAEEVMEGSWSFRIKLPHAERPTLAWQDLAD